MTCCAARRAVERRPQRRQAQRGDRHDERRGVGRGRGGARPASTSSSVRSSRTRRRPASSTASRASPDRASGSSRSCSVATRPREPVTDLTLGAAGGFTVLNGVLRGSAEPGRRRPRVQAGRAGRRRGGDGPGHGPADAPGGPATSSSRPRRRWCSRRSRRRTATSTTGTATVPSRHEPDRRRLDGAQRRRAVDVVHDPPAELPAVRGVGASATSARRCSPRRSGATRCTSPTTATS